MANTCCKKTILITSMLITLLCGGNLILSSRNNEVGEFELPWLGYIGISTIPTLFIYITWSCCPVSVGMPLASTFFICLFQFIIFVFTIKHGIEFITFFSDSIVIVCNLIITWMNYYYYIKQVKIKSKEKNLGLLDEYINQS